MALQTHACWGRPLSVYVESFGGEEIQTRVDLTEDTRHLAEAAIERIAHVTPNRTDHGVTLLELQTILVYTRSQLVTSYISFSSPSLTEGCIYLMAQISVAGKTSPFSYEYGYLCFRIMTISIGIGLLQNSIGAEYTLANMVLDPNTPLIHTLSRHVAQLTEGAISHGGGQGRETYNCGIGWSRCSDHPKQQPEVVSRAAIGSLLETLWEDRESFLKAMGSTISPELSGVIYVLWRYVIYERAYLVATPDQGKVFMLLSSLNYENSKIWNSSPKHNQLGDSKQIIRAFATQIMRPKSPLPLGHFPNALNFIHRHSLPGCEEEAPLLIGAIISQIWDQFLAYDGTKERGKLVDVISNVFNWFRYVIFAAGGHSKKLRSPISGMLEPFATSRSNQPLMLRIIDTVIQSELLSLIGRIMLSLVPTVDPRPTRDVVRNGTFFKSSEDLFKNLSQIVPTHALVKLSEPYMHEWWRFYQHLGFLEELAVGSARALFYDFCIRIWTRLRESLGHLSLTATVGLCTSAKSVPKSGIAVPGAKRGEYDGSENLFYEEADFALWFIGIGFMAAAKGPAGIVLTSRTTLLFGPNLRFVANRRFFI
ncbi:hypothetical protein FRC11_008432 [Ceratobasidium sp. 423]|nr:hypothetical protein FRC11_008432 [Ceratobasidium sp. 423]